MAVIYPEIENIQRLKVAPTPGEWELIRYLNEHLDEEYEVFFNPHLDGDRPDIIVLKEACGAFVIEVKDWDLRNYKVSEDNKWEVVDRSMSSRKASPQSQCFRYKKNLYDLHLPVVGLSSLTNHNFFKLVHCFVYFHNSDRCGIDSLYRHAEERQNDERSKLNESFQANKVDFYSYEKERIYLDRQRRKLQRDKDMSFGFDRLDRIVKSIKKQSKHVLFDDNVYREFKRRLSPSAHTLRQGVPIEFDKKQVPLTESKKGKEKIKGVAGCGKTSILAHRAINAYQRHKSPVLILTFNITLKNYIRDKISDIQGNRDFSFFEISNYHQFYNSQVNNTEQDISDLIDRYGMGRLYSIDVFKDCNVTMYQTILVDEVQDYQSEWVKIIRDNFLYEDGEMILFGDECQDIYKRDVARSPVIAQGFGRWIELNRSYRTTGNSPLNQLFRTFQLDFLAEKHSDTTVADVSPRETAQIGMGFDIIKYEEVPESGWKDTVFERMKEYIRRYAWHPNDVVVLASTLSLVRQLNDLWIKTEGTHCMFETYEELAACTRESKEDLKRLDEHELNVIIQQNEVEIRRIRRAKKNHFYANSGLVKLSTIQSYKGLEAETVLYVMGEKDDVEVAYTSITRTSKNLVIFDVGSKNVCSGFLKEAIR